MKRFVVGVLSVFFCLTISAGAVSIPTDVELTQAEYIEAMSAECEKYGMTYEFDPTRIESGFEFSRENLETELSAIRELGETSYENTDSISEELEADSIRGNIEPTNVLQSMPVSRDCTGSTMIYGSVPPSYAELYVTASVTTDAQRGYYIISANNVRLFLRGASSNVEDYCRLVSSSVSINNTYNTRAYVKVTGKVQLKINSVLGSGWVYQDYSFNATLYPFR